MNGQYLYYFPLMSCRWTIDVGWTSTWVRIVNEWIAVCVYRKCPDKKMTIRYASSVCIASSGTTRFHFNILKGRLFLSSSVDARGATHMGEHTSACNNMRSCQEPLEFSFRSLTILLLQKTKGGMGEDVLHCSYD